ncbi:MAG: endonuclease/exonuclease/phosphatase family protein [Bacteroidales bacterium]|nr:endonuclease/exonuclease/phosphatase family protein [Bacteroidales bacterium]
MKRIVFVLTVMLSVLCLSACNFNGSSKPKKGKKVELRICSYNIWAHYAREGQIAKNNAHPSRSWDKSKEDLVDLIVKMDCDIIGMQEVSAVCRDDINDLLQKAGADYELWWKNTYPEGHKRVVGNAVLFRKGVFRFDNRQIYYFSPTPEVMSSGWDEAKYIRGALTATVTHLKTGRKFFFIATHGPLGDIASGHAGRILVEIDQKYNKEGLPTIVVGDMNARPGDEFHVNMCGHYQDSYEIAGKKCGNVGTFNGAAGLDENFQLEHRRIDHIYVHSTESGNLEVKSYQVNRDKYESDGQMNYPSDHNPVVVDMILK